jgi:predicted GNAT family acetyltransferase
MTQVRQVRAYRQSGAIAGCQRTELLSMNPHPLDRPVWSALATRQMHFALGDGRARRFDPVFGLFAAAADASTQSRAALAALVLKRDAVALVEAEPQPEVPGVSAETHIIWQMVAEHLVDGPPPAAEIVPLAEADAPQMLALATFTKPGPFFARTHRLGHFVGVKRDGELVAMAGERMKPEGFTELSGVCTAPGYRGLGYAGALSRLVSRRILASGEIPFLHVYAHNTDAIALYQTLGFTLRREMYMQVLTHA